MSRFVLPQNPSPRHYDLSLRPDLTNFTFEGTANIELEVSEEISEIKLNSLTIAFKAVTVVQGGSVQEIDGSKVDINEKDEVSTIPLPQPLTSGQATLSIEFSGVLGDNLKGFYRSKYVKDGETKWLATTQFEPTDARRAFPCWDEPARKATFSVTLTAPKESVVLSNMPEASQDAEGDVKKVVFQKTPIMSTYLLAWVVGDFEAIEDKTVNGTVIRVWTPLGRSKEGRFALDVACKCLPFLEGYFDIPYPLPKSDLIAIPDFSAGAMENWGLITYRDSALLTDENSSAASRERVALVVCHELVHQWFGNLVTMDWWSELWLNEGFACFMQYLSTDHIFPEWKVFQTFLSSEVSRALTLDSLLSSHPIEVNVNHAQEVDEIFDAISYSKGASIIACVSKYRIPSLGFLHEKTTNTF